MGVISTLMSVASAGLVRDWADSYCNLAAKIMPAQVGKTFNNKQELATLYGDFAALFAPKMDCSEDPGNPYGFDLKGVTLNDCLAAKVEQQKHFKKIAFGEFKCLEIIADEKESTGALWIEWGNTGEYTKKAFSRGAFRFAVNGG